MAQSRSHLCTLGPKADLVYILGALGTCMCTCVVSCDALYLPRAASDVQVGPEVRAFGVRPGRWTTKNP